MTNEIEIDWKKGIAKLNEIKEIKKPFVQEKNTKCKTCGLYDEPFDSFYCGKCYYFPKDHPIPKRDRRNFHTREHAEFWEKKAKKV